MTDGPLVSKPAPVISGTVALELLTAARECVDIIENEIRGLIDSGTVRDADGKPIMETLDDAHAAIIAEFQGALDKARAAISRAEAELK